MARTIRTAKLFVKADPSEGIGNRPVGIVGGEEGEMRREDVTMAMIALAEGEPYTPVQIQKALFLVSREAGDVFSPRSKFDFRPYDYGPFDRNVYTVLQGLQAKGLVEIDTDPRYGWRRYSATTEGIGEGKRLLEVLSPRHRAYLSKVSGFVRRLSFNDLVSAIYRAYPEMRANSVFAGT